MVEHRDGHIARLIRTPDARVLGLVADLGEAAARVGVEAEVLRRAGVDRAHVQAVEVDLDVDLPSADGSRVFVGHVEEVGVGEGRPSARHRDGVLVAVVVALSGRPRRTAGDAVPLDDCPVCVRYDPLRGWRPV